MIFSGSDLDLTCLQHHARLEIHEGQLVPKAKLLPYCESTLAVEPTLAMIATASQPDLARVVLSADSQTLFLRYESGDSRISLHNDRFRFATPAVRIFILHAENHSICMHAKTHLQNSACHRHACMHVSHVKTNDSGC